MDAILIDADAFYKEQRRTAQRMRGIDKAESIVAYNIVFSEERHVCSHVSHSVLWLHDQAHISIDNLYKYVESQEDLPASTGLMSLERADLFYRLGQFTNSAMWYRKAASWYEALSAAMQVVSKDKEAADKFRGLMWAAILAAEESSNGETIRGDHPGNDQPHACCGDGQVQTASCTQRD